MKFSHHKDLNVVTNKNCLNNYLLLIISVTRNDNCAIIIIIKEQANLKLFKYY